MTYPNLAVVVVDNGSTDGSCELVSRRFPGVHLLANGANVGYAAGMNVGFEYAAGSGAAYFLLLNNDTVIHPDAASALVRAAQAVGNAAGVTGKVYFYDAPGTLQTIGISWQPGTSLARHIGLHEPDQGQHDLPAEREFADDVMLLVDRRAYDAVGGYDPQFFLQGAPLEWQLRARAHGWKLAYTPEARISHKVSLSMGGFDNPTARYFDSQSGIVLMAQHAGARAFLRYYATTGLHVTGSLVRGLLQMNPGKIRPRLALWLGFVGGTLWLLHRRPARRVPPLVALLSNWGAGGYRA
jgi:GT2 family glycosyltransferase